MTACCWVQWLEWVGVAGEDGGGAIELFGEDEAGDGVERGVKDPRREDGFGAEEGIGRPAVGGSDGKDDVLDAFLAVGTEPSGDEFRGHGAAVAIEEDGEDRACGCGGGRPRRREAIAGVLKHSDLERTSGRGSLEVAGGELLEGVTGWGEGGADVGESGDVHAEEDTAPS